MQSVAEVLAPRDVMIMLPPRPPKALTIVDPVHLTRIADELSGNKALQKEAHSKFDPICVKTHEAWQEALKQRKSVIDPLEEDERILKGAIAVYARKVEQEQLAEQRRLEAAAREAAEAQLEQEIEQAEAEGASVAEVGAIIDRPLMVAPVVAPPLAPKPSGFTTRETWSAELTDKWALVEFIVKNGRKDLLGLLSADTGAINSMARALKSAFDVPGIVVKNGTNIAVRGARG